jgi:hypothetical protein
MSGSMGSYFYMFIYSDPPHAYRKLAGKRFYKVCPVCLITSGAIQYGVPLIDLDTIVVT